jgi:hypothetical protein
MRLKTLWGLQISAGKKKNSRIFPSPQANRRDLEGVLQKVGVANCRETTPVGAEKPREVVIRFTGRRAYQANEARSDVVIDH